MIGTTSNIANNCRQHFLVFATILLVLLTSCVVKGSIKSLAGIPLTTERSIPKGNQHFSSNSTEKCAEYEVSSSQIVQKSSISTNNLMPVVIFTTAFLFLFGLQPVSKENKHPVYSGSSKIRSAVPLFLEYRKLILHFSH